MARLAGSFDGHSGRSACVQRRVRVRNSAEGGEEHIQQRNEQRRFSVVSSCSRQGNPQRIKRTDWTPCGSRMYPSRLTALYHESSHVMPHAHSALAFARVETKFRSSVAVIDCFEFMHCM